MRSKRRGLLFGPREAGCWISLLQQAWLCFAVTAGLAWLIPTSTVVAIMSMFLSEAVVISLLMLTVSQLFWASEHLQWIPDWFYQLLGWLFLLMLVCPVCHRLTSNDVFRLLFVGLGSLFGGLLILSLLVRIATALRNRSSNAQGD